MPSYVKCEYLKCNNRKAGHPNKCFFKIPEDSERCKAWLEAMGREDLMVILPKKLHNNFRVCADHFEDKYFTSTLRTHLNRKAIPCKVGTISTGQVMMDEIKMEPEVDPLGLQPDENTLEVKENTTLSEVGNLSHLQVADIKTECVDGWYDLTPEIKVEDIPEPVSFAIVKSEPESTPVPYIYPTIKSEVDEDSFHLERVQQEVKLEISSEDNEGMLGRNANNVKKSHSSEFDSYARDQVELTKYCSYKLDSLFGCDLSRESNKCNICNEVFVTAESLKRHYQTHTLKKSRKCEVCGKCFSRSAHLIRHSHIHTGKRPFECDLCGKCFSESGNLKLHYRVHTGERPFKCDVCGKCFARSEILKNHSRTHTGERPFKCDLCGRSFSHLSSLKYHSRIHTGERRFKCDVCGKCFVLLSSLKYHSSLHMTEKPYKCDVCAKTFSRSKSLKEHSRLHSGDGPFKCDVCGKKYSISYHLQRHLVLHTGEGPFKCDYCGKCFPRKGYLIRHIHQHVGQR